MKKYKFLTPLILALLLMAFCLLPTEMNAQTVHEWKGGEEIIPVGAAPPGPIEFKNKSKTDFYDFTIVIESQNGLPLPFSIDTVTIDGKTYNETHNTGSFVRIEADTNGHGAYESGERIPKNNSTTRTIRVTLTSHPTVPYNIRIQPTSNTASAVMVSADGNFGPCGSYLTTFSPEGVLANTYEGMMFNDVNTTAIELNELFLQPMGPPFFIMDAVLLDGNGLPVPGSIFSPSGGVLSFPFPILPGQEFGVQIFPNQLIPNAPMMVQACLGLPPFPEPFFEISAVNQIDLHLPGGQGINTAGELRFKYETPLTSAESYLNILYQPIAFGDTNIYWIGQNITLEHFYDTMELSMGFDMLPGQATLPPTAPSLCNFAITISDTIYTDISHFGPVFFSPYIFITRDILIGPNLPLPPIPPITFPGGIIPPLPPRHWETTTSKGVLIGCNMINIDLDSSSYRSGEGGPYVPNDYAGDWNACGPVATANSFSWLRSIHPDIDAKLGAAFGQGDSAQRKMLAEFSEMMDRLGEDQVSIRDFIEAKLDFIDKYKLPMRVAYQSVFLVQAGDSTIDSPNDCYGHKARNESVNPPNPAPHGRISPDWVYDRLGENCDTEILLQWMKVDAMGNITYTNGHYVTLTGIRQNNGNWRIRWKDDTDQSDEGGLRHGISDMTVDNQGIVWIPGLDNPALGRCFVEDVIVECYDSTVTHNSTKGRAFEDSNGSGTQDPGEGGVEGVTVKLMDSNTGLEVGETKTDKDGNYLFPDLPPGDYHVAFSDLPPGYDYSAKDVGADDEIDSDVNILGVSDQFTLNGSPQGHLDAGLVPNRIVRIAPKVILQTTLDPATQEMIPLLDNQGFLPETEPFTAMGMSLMAYRYDSLERYYFTVKPIDWIVIELRDANDSTLILGALPAVILPDGTIVGANGQPLTFFGIPHGNFFVVIRPRNGLALMTNFAIYLDNDPTQIDFTSPSLPVYGTDSRTPVGGKMAITAGDVNFDGVVNAADRSGTWNNRNAVGYLPWDINFDGVVNAADRSGTWNNRNKQQELP